MTRKDTLTLFAIEDISDLPSAIMNIIERGDNSEQKNLYKELLRLNNNDVSYDWFQLLHEDELSEQKRNGQHFSPPELGRLLSTLTGRPNGVIHEPTAGTGDMIIQDWWERCTSTFPFNYRPSDNIVSCWELSSRSVPILLINLAVRGIMGEVYHGDVLERTIKNRYVLINEQDDFLAFSKIIKQ